MELTRSVAAEVADQVFGDRLRLRQVLLNLIGNAVKFSEKGKIEVKVATGKRISDEKNSIIFTVTDTGVGIPDDKKNLLFQAFSQVDSSSTRRFGGTGLGSYNFV